jgi:hypothetical protein
VNILWISGEDTVGRASLTDTLLSGMLEVGLLPLLVGLGLMVGTFALPFWALRRHARMFPKGWDRTGWTTERGKTGRFATMWAYFAGGRGS